MVENPAQFRWSSYNAYVSKHNTNYGIIERNAILSMLSDDEEQAIKLFIMYSNELDDVDLIDLQEENRLEKSILNETDARLYVAEFINKHVQQGDIEQLMEKREIRNELILELKANSTLSIREIARILGIDRNIVQRVK